MIEQEDKRALAIEYIRLMRSQKTTPALIEMLIKKGWNVENLKSCEQIPDSIIRKLLQEDEKEKGGVLTSAYLDKLFEEASEQRALVVTVANDARQSEERADVSEYLKNPQMFTLAVEELHKMIEGELAARYVLFLCVQGRLVQNVEPCSFNMLVSSESGAGKDWITRNIVKLLPTEQFEYRTRISRKAFTYWHSSKKEPEWTWDGKVCYLEDIANDVLNDDVFKVMASSGSKATVVVEGKAVDLEIKGKPVIFLTSATASPKHELLRRFGIITLDETCKQTRDIMRRKASEAAKGKAEAVEYNDTFIEAQRRLKRVSVLVPFAERFLDIFPADHLIMRTLFSRFVDWIKASAAFHQFQRKSENGYVIAEGEDYEIARQAMQAVITNRYMLPLTKDELRIMELAESEGFPNPFTIDEIGEKATWISERTLRRKLDRLATFGFLERGTIRDDYARRPIVTYTRKPLGSLRLPAWSELLTIRQIRQADNHDNLSNIT